MTEYKSNKLLQILLDPIVRYALTAVFSIGIALGAGVRHGLIDPYSHTTSTSIRAFTQLEYEKIKPNMSLIEVIAILGNGRELSRTDTVVKMTWENSDGSSIVAIFHDNILKEKMQVGEWIE